MNAPQLLNLTEVCKQTSLCKTSIYIIPDFPRPIKIGGADAPMQGGSRWVKSEVVAWLRSRIEARGGSLGAIIVTTGSRNSAQRLYERVLAFRPWRQSHIFLMMMMKS